MQRLLLVNSNCEVAKCTAFILCVLGELCVTKTGSHAKDAKDAKDEMMSWAEGWMG